MLADRGGSKTNLGSFGYHKASCVSLPLSKENTRIFFPIEPHVVFFYVFAVRFDKLYWPAASHKLMAKRAGVFFYDLQSPLA